jgi:hypothetical protein
VGRGVVGPALLLGLPGVGHVGVPTTALARECCNGGVVGPPLLLVRLEVG